jgi:acyl-[acyl-carrier-protein]-phospholipid O-acyltransferase/long-chain-fatty-acid--[acyl-carrier-protein] ligase
MVPADVFVVEGVPLLGSGKPDYVSALQLAKDTVANSRPKAQPIVAAV